MSNDSETITGITAAPLASDVPQFSTAEYGHVPGSERCKICGNLISGEYFRVNLQMACGKCAGEARDGQPSDSHAAFARAVLLGAGAALIGLIFYSSFAIITNLTIGYLALAVGWLIAKAMMKGSNGVGGTRYQIAAVLLTYAAISMSSIPILISYAIKHHHSEAQSAAQSASGQSSPGTQDIGAQSQSTPKQINWGAAVAQLALWGLASPFLELQSPGSGFLGLIILFVGLSIAFRMTKAKPLDVDGPYSVTA